ncbi:RING-finger domain containing protein [Colletotrichum plurivorum]|uniref:RING-finger domain containing protein n=1 Tax=Colletotrichum plurivorum TaxID=2175906 RepID=A0A8H6NPC6_9PEZI|nr:RING-finger domain containing protein [Colletotrichum plurivorum]
MDDSMDYVYHHRPELHPNHTHLPYLQQPRCPYYNRGDSSYNSHPTFTPPHRSMGQGRYDPVHASASHWHSGTQPSPLPHWSSPVMPGMPGAGSGAPTRQYLNQPDPVAPPQSQYGPVAGASIPSMYNNPYLPPPVRSGYGSIPDPISHHAPALPAPQTLPNPNIFAHAGRGYGNSPASRSSDPFNAALPSLLATSQNTPAPESSEPSMESQSVSEPTSTSEAATQVDQTALPPRSIQFGSLSPDRPRRTEPATASEPPAEAGRVSSAPLLENIQFGSAPRLSTLVHPPASASASGVENPPPALQAPMSTETLPHDPAVATAGSSNMPSGSLDTSSPAFQPPPERRRTTIAATRRTFSRRQQSPPMEHNEEMRALERYIIHGRMGAHDMDDNRIRAAQFLRGSVSTKMVASSSAIQSLQSVALSDLSESERSNSEACVICYNEFGVETPEGLKEAPLRLPKCKHVFGDHCIKKWFEESDSCPYCRDKMPSEPRMTSTNSMINRYIHRGFGETDIAHGASDSSLGSASVPGHGERRSPPTDGGESRRRTRARHSAGRGPHTPHSPPFGASRVGPFGGSSSSAMDPTRRSLAFTFSGRGNHPSNVPHRMGAPLPFPYHIPSPAFGGAPDPTSSSSPGPLPGGLPQYAHPLTSRGIPFSRSSAFASHANRNSLPNPEPGNWNIANAPASEEQQRDHQPGDSAAPQRNRPPSYLGLY